MSNLQTDNSYLTDKIQLRINHLPEKKEINVLDLFAGSSKIWNTIKIQTNKKINVLSVDKKNIQNKVYLKGNNIKFLKNLDLTKFDVIDIDSYGVPYPQLKLIFAKSKIQKINAIIFITFIQSVYGKINKGLLKELCYTEKMINKIPTLFSKNGFEKFKLYLALNGIKKINYIQRDKKYYIATKFDF